MWVLFDFLLAKIIGKITPRRNIYISLMYYFVFLTETEFFVLFRLIFLLLAAGEAPFQFLRLFIYLFFFVLFRATGGAYGSSQARS